MSDANKANIQPPDLVIVGAPTGNIEALTTFVSTLPKDFPAPIILVQHLDLGRPTTLDLILQRRTPLPVQIVNSSSRLEAGKIYIVPAHRKTAIHDFQIEVQGNQHPRLWSSLDALLSEAAEQYGDHLIGVLLAGSSSDGAAGIVEVKNADGTVIIQDQKTARYPSIPLTLPPTIIDFEVSIEQIGQLLYDLLTDTPIESATERTEDILQNILEQVSHQASIDFRPYKTSTILRRIGRRMTVTHTRTMPEYLDYLRTYPEEVGELVKAFLINVTQFFRDPDAFAYLRSDVLPRMIALSRERDRVLRFWTAGCATGEEPYSLAMLLTDMLGAELPEWSIKIFATDLDEAAINFARRGLYSENLLKGVPNDYRERFFERVDMGYRISKTLRQMVIFGQQDLSRSAPFPRIDMVICRNVLIYFTPELQDYVLNQFAFSLCPNGYLFLGKAETVRPLQTYYELVNKHWKIYRCVGSMLPGTRRPAQPNITRREGRSLARTGRNGAKLLNDAEPLKPSLDVGQLRHFNELLLRFLPIGIVVIDRSYRILTANSAARRLLGLRDVGTEQDFLHTVRGIPYQAVRTAIDAVFRERNPVNLPEVELDANTGGNGRFLSLSMALMQLENNHTDLASVSIADVTEQVQVRRQLETVQMEQSQLMNELSTVNKRLSDVNKELLDANEELQVANEELVLTHEELQASLEEFETTNEELQATNEELETNNEELQATNEELEATNEELRARTNELQELASMLDSERVRLEEMVELAPFYIMVLRGPNLLVEAYNPHYGHLLEGRAIQGRPLEEVSDVFWEPEQAASLIRLIRETYRLDEMRKTAKMQSTRLQSSKGKSSGTYFVYNIVPSHDTGARVNGVILYAVDETEQHTQEIVQEREQLRLIFENTAQAALALFDARTAQLIIASPHYIDIHTQLKGRSQNEILQMNWFQLSDVEAEGTKQQLWSTVVAQRTPIHLPEVRYVYPRTGQETVWDYNMTPIIDKERRNEVRFVLISGIEVTEQAQTRRELERLDVLKDEFLSITTHELRTPLTAILGNVQLLQSYIRRQSGSLSDEQIDQLRFEQNAQLLNRILQQVNRMSGMIDEMLDVTYIRNQSFSLNYTNDVNIVALLRSVVEQQNSQQHPVILEASQEDIRGSIDETRVEQVMNNLISNAKKYSEVGKPVFVKIERAAQSGDEVIVSVLDEGVGIAKEEQDHIFDRFYRAHNAEGARIEGLGLGLYISHEIVAQQGGRMWLESEPGRGSTFYFSLPLKQA